MSPALLDIAKRWCEHDLDAATRAELARLIEAADPVVDELFGDRIAFGTAGLRAAVGIGPARMNAVVVAQTAIAVVRWLDAPRPRVLIGYDGRRDSAAFARWAAAGVRAAGGSPLVGDRAAATPLIAHAVVADSDAEAAFVITASHNPAPDNGFKLYLGDGMQIVPPAETGIAEAIERVATEWPELAAAVRAEAAGPAPDALDVNALALAHRRDAVSTAGRRAPEMPVPLAYTPMHGIGGADVVEALAAAGHRRPALVVEQFEPDPDFATVAFPNPEEPGALDLLLAQADASGAVAAIANDPDADRLAMAVRSRHSDGWAALSGDELGVLFADFLLRSTTGPRLVARSVVSSRMLDAMAEAHADVVCAVTLTGFKWIARARNDHPDRRWLFGYEEAIGYCIGSHVRDKDGITAAVIAADMVAQLETDGATVWQRLDELAVAHGLYLTGPVTLRFDDEPDRIDAVVDRLSVQPPATLAGSVVVSAGAIGGGALPPTPGAQMIATDSTQVIVRPSGTEPKVKAYIEIVEPVADAADLDRARAVGAERLERVRAEVDALLRS